MGGTLMATTINAAASAGLVTTADTSTILQLQTAGVTALSISAAQVVSFTNPITLTSPTLVTPLLGTPTSGTLTNCTFPTLNQNTTGSSASCTGNSATATSLSTIVGSAPSYACRAWVNFNGTGTVAIRASGNVSSITDNGVGDYTVNFTTAMPDAAYSCQAFTTATVAGNNSSGAQMYTVDQTGILAGSVRIGTGSKSSGAALDYSSVHVAIFR